MTQELVSEHIRSIMEERGAAHYRTKLRHFLLAPGTVIHIDAPAQLMVLAEDKECIRVESETGIFDLSDSNTNELRYEHQGAITLTNYSAIAQHVIMIQVFFKQPL